MWICKPSRSNSAHNPCAILLSFLFLFSFLPAPAASASTVAVRYKEGLIHGFLTLTTLDGVVIAHGEVMQIAHGDQVTSHLIFHFKDGSLQEETAVYSQDGVFRLISYRQVQKGPSFKSATDLSIKAATGEVTIHSTDDKGKEKDWSEHIDLPDDLANGMLPTLLKNLPAGAEQAEFAMLVATPKPRLVKLEIAPSGADAFTFGSAHKATRYVIKINLGGVAKIVAPVVGKQPPDDRIWILGGDAPEFVKSEALSYEGGPMWRTVLAAPVWPKTASDSSVPSPEKR